MTCKANIKKSSLIYRVVGLANTAQLAGQLQSAASLGELISTWILLPDPEKPGKTAFPRFSGCWIVLILPNVFPGS
jgi:hypothetical protein